MISLSVIIIKALLQGLMTNSDFKRQRIPPPDYKIKGKLRNFNFSVSLFIIHTAME